MSRVPTLERKEKEAVVVEIPVLCRLWEEDGVWNGEAVDLPIAVFGKTFEEAQKNLQHAMISHLETLQEVGSLERTIDFLRMCAKEHRVSIDEMASNKPLVKLSAGLQDHRVVCIA